MNIIGWRPGPRLVLSMRIRTTFLPWYSKRQARRYEAKRQGSMWRGETEAFRHLYDRVRPRTVLDAPVGTGRWFERYQADGVTVLGVDLSREMLAEAAKKIGPGGNIRLQQGDLLNRSRVPELGRDHDLVVCTRFAHWLRPRDLPGLARNLAATGSRHLLIGARMRLDRQMEGNGASGGWWRRLFKMSYLHDEAEFLASFAAAGWQPVDKKLVVRTRRFRYYFYLLRLEGEPGEQAV